MHCCSRPTSVHSAAGPAAGGASAASRLLLSQLLAVAPLLLRLPLLWTPCLLAWLLFWLLFQAASAAHRRPFRPALCVTAGTPHWKSARSWAASAAISWGVRTLRSLSRSSLSPLRRHSGVENKAIGHPRSPEVNAAQEETDHVSQIPPAAVEHVLWEAGNPARL